MDGPHAQRVPKARSLLKRQAPIPAKSPATARGLQAPVTESSLRSRLLSRESSMDARHPNNFLASLPAKDFELLRPHLMPFDLVHEDLLFDAGETLNWAYLPHSGVISLVVGLTDGR